MVKKYFFWEKSNVLFDVYECDERVLFLTNNRELLTWAPKLFARWEKNPLLSTVKQLSPTTIYILNATILLAEGRTVHFNRSGPNRYSTVCNGTVTLICPWGALNNNF